MMMVTMMDILSTFDLIELRVGIYILIGELGDLLFKDEICWP